MLTNTITIRQGSTFSYAALLALPVGVTWTLKCTIEDKNGLLLQELTTTIQLLPTPTSNHETHSILLEASGLETSKWPVDTYIGRCIFKDNSAIVRTIVSGSFFIAVQEV